MSKITVGLGLNTPTYDVSESQLSAPSRKASVDGGNSIRSASSMQGLLQAEIGEAMVELDAGNGTSGFKQGSRIITESLASCTQSLHSSSTFIASGHDWSPEKASLSRHGTLLTSNATPSRNTAQLKSILGNSNARLKPGASIVPVGALSSAESTSLEQAKPRARVEVDVIPETNIFVQGGYINGTIKIRIRPRSRTESEVLISDGKIRVVGFECIQNEKERHTFYQQSVSLSDASPSAELLFDSPPDNEGFYAAKEGVHVLPFSMYLVLEGGEGTPKGTISPHSGIAIRYIVMISVKVREVETDRRSIAHFYRDCEVWPRFNPSAMLSPAAQPIRGSAAKSLLMGGSGKVGLTASLHRIYWVAGQQGCVKVRIINKSKKTIKNLTLTLLRSTVAYKPNPHLDVEGSDEHDADACQTSTVQKQVAECVLEMGQRDHTRGHASAKGWWAGVRPEETSEFCHFLSIPSDAITIPRARLLEIAYNLRVTISAGPIASNIHVVLPIRIINFLSIDPPPSFPREDQAILDFLGQKPPPEIDEIPNTDVPFTLNGRVLEPLSEDDAADAEYEGDLCAEIDNEYISGRSGSSQSSISEDVTTTNDDTHPTQLGNATACDDDNSFVQQAVTSLKVDIKYGECGGRFADLYYSTEEVSLPLPSSDTAETYTPRPATPKEYRLSSPHSSTSSGVSESDLARPRSARPRGPSSFAERVQQKLQAKDDNQLLQRNDSQINRERGADESASFVSAPPNASQEPSVGQSNLYRSKRTSSQAGGTAMARQRSSTAGSYFRPREEIPDEVEVLDEEGGDESPSRSPFAEITRKASALSSLTTGGSKASSRMLLNIPSSRNTGLPPQSGGSVLMRDGAVDGVPPRVVPTGASDTIGVTSIHPDHQMDIVPEHSTQIPYKNTRTKSSTPITGRARSHTLAAPPSDRERPVSIDQSPLKFPVGGNSVKDRIRMLEEKARAEERLENLKV